MTYPQPDSDRAALAGLDYFRLNTKLVSPGDIYESVQGAKAFAIGPESDISRIRAYYIDEQTPTTRMSNFVVSADRSYLGSVYARLDAQYEPARRPGRILLATDDIYDPSWRPTGFEPGDVVNFVPPVFDVIQYFKKAPGLWPQRVDKRHYFQGFDDGLSGSITIVIPYYGRRYASFRIKNVDADVASSLAYTFGAVNFAITDDADATAIKKHQQVTFANAALAQYVSASFNATAGIDGMFDAVFVKVDRDTASVVHITVSDHSESKDAA